MKIGVLALQGAFAEHAAMVERLGAEYCLIRQRQDFSKALDGLIIPGGESTAMGRLLYDMELLWPIKEAITDGMPVLGTCAGCILMAETIQDSAASYLAVMDITVQRNAYGRQLDSFTAQGKLQGSGEIPMVFIRAPKITRVGGEVQILCTAGSDITAVKQKNMLAATFHPELTNNVRLHQYFLNLT